MIAGKWRYFRQNHCEEWAKQFGMGKSGEGGMVGGSGSTGER